MKENPIVMMAAIMSSESRPEEKPRVSEVDYKNLAALAIEMNKKNELLKAFLASNKDELGITVTIGDTSYTFEDGDSEFDELCDIIHNIDVDTDWSDFTNS